MINHFPFFGPPQFFRPGPYLHSQNPNVKKNIVTHDNQHFVNEPSNVFGNNKKCFGPNSINRNSFNTSVVSNNLDARNSKSEIRQAFDKDSSDFFEIFGLKLYFDDLLIISLLFFLYQEDVKDTYLYIALILLLLS